MDTNRDAVTISIEDDLKSKNERPAPGFSPDFTEEDPLGTDDQAEVRPRL